MLLTEHAPPIFRIFFELNYLDNALKGVVTSILGMNREKLPCDDMYCHFGNPKKVMRDFGAEVDLTKAFSVIFVYYTVFQIITYFMMRYRLKNFH
jgi:ATP-binding cassette, subfamily G (WHITE), member 1